MPDKYKAIIDSWGLYGLGIGVTIGFVFEVFLIRSNTGKIRWGVSLMSVVAIGLMGWLSWCIATEALPDARWKVALWTLGVCSNTWWTAKFALSGQMFRVITSFLLPESLKKAMEDKK